MNTLLWFLITLALAFVGGTIAIRLKIPAGGMIGGMLAVAILNILTGNCIMYPEVKIAVQICLGAMSGSRVGKKEVLDMKRLIVPIMLMFLVCLTLNVFFGIAVLKTTSLDISTALLAITPGGATDMIFVAADIGADTGMVGIMQSLRMIFSNCILTLIFVAMIKRHEKREHKTTYQVQASQRKKTQRADHYWLRVAGMYATASAGGLLFRKLGVPGGTLVGAMVFTVIHNCILGKVEYPSMVKKYQQVFTGAYIGVGITAATLAQIPSVAIGMLLSIVDIMVYVLLMSFVLRKTSRMDYGTSLLCSTPGGIGEVSILSEELNTDTPTVAVFNTARMILIVATFPIILQMISRALGA
ncbi:MAG: AbrB family transcriptional regulator [Clostridia bacterium]|nr:AbrB family transcriptional regulator [Clostridia bacterium]